MKMEEIDILTKRLKKLVESNHESYTLLTGKLPNMEMNTTDARLQTLLEALCETVWTEEQYLNFEINFNRKIEKALHDAWDQIRAQEKAASLIVPKKGRLFVPNQD
jgi:hypothetical protein